MQHTSRIISRHEPMVPHGRRVVYRKLSLQLYELEPDSGEDESLHVDLPLDQLED